MDPNFTTSHRGGSGPPMVLIHGITDTWRSWELVLPELEKHHDVLALTLPGHKGGPAIEGEINERVLTGAVEAAMDEAGFETAHVVGNSLGGYLALHMAALGRARTTVALAPAGGWASGDESYRDALEFFVRMNGLLKADEPHAEAIVSSMDGQRQATQFITERYEHIPADLIAHQIRGAAGCAAAIPLIEYATDNGWALDTEGIRGPVRIVWDTQDRVLA